MTGWPATTIYGLEVTQSNSNKYRDDELGCWHKDGNNTFIYASRSFAYGSANIPWHEP